MALTKKANAKQYNDYHLISSMDHTLTLFRGTVSTKYIESLTKPLAKHTLGFWMALIPGNCNLHSTLHDASHGSTCLFTLPRLQ